MVTSKVSLQVCSSLKKNIGILVPENLGCQLWFTSQHLPYTEPTPPDQLEVRESCHDANCFWHTITTSAPPSPPSFCIYSLKCLENNLLPVPPSVTLAGTHHISLSLRRCGPLAIASPPPWPRWPRWRQRGRHERHNQTRGIRADAGACRMQSDIRNTAEPDPLLLRPSHRQSCTFNLLWLSVAHK